MVESRIAYPPQCEGRSPGHGPGGSTCHAGTRTYTYHTIRALLFAAGHRNSYITIRREPSRVFPPAWQCHSHDCTVFSQGWRGWVFERKRGWLLRVRWPAVALFQRTRLGVPRTRSEHEFALCETRDRIRAQLVSACFGYVTRVKRVSLSLRCLRCQGLAGFVVVVG